MPQEAHNATQWGSATKVFLEPKNPTDDFSKDAIKASGMEDKRSEQISVFDNGCGGGGTALVVARGFPNATVVAGDFAPSMVEATKQKIQHERLTNITAEVQDGVNLTLESNQFDFVFCQFTVMFFPDYKKGFEEMYRVTKEGGTCIIITWKDPSTTRYIEEARLRVTDTIVEHNTQGHANFFEKPELLIEYAKNAGFKTTEVTEASHVWWFTYEMFESFTTNPAVILMGDGLNEEQMQQYLQEIRNIGKEKNTTHGIQLDAIANILKATK